MSTIPPEKLARNSNPEFSRLVMFGGDGTPDLQAVLDLDQAKRYDDLDASQKMTYVPVALKPLLVAMLSICVLTPVDFVTSSMAGAPPYDGQL